VPSLAARFLDLFDAAESPQGLRARVLGRHAVLLQALDLAFEVELELVAQIRFAAAPENDRAQPAVQDVPRAHG
jgi:hypothetical protein